MNELLNLVGLSTGLALYLMLLLMIVRGQRAAGARDHAQPIDRLPLATALLGLAWNVSGLLGYALPLGFSVVTLHWIAATGFIALGFLPAVVVHSVARGGRARANRALHAALLVAAYGASSAAAVLQVLAVWHAERLPSVAGMRALTYTFVALIVPLVLVTRRQAGSRRAFWAVALAAFAVSALHLSQLREGVSWPIELAGHHASIPLALAILYEDFPFAFADLFLKRALTLMVLVATAFGGLVLTGWAAEPAVTLGAPSRIGVLVVLWVGTALLYPFLRRGVAWFVDTIVLARPDYRWVEATIARRLQSYDQTDALLTDVCALIAPALSATTVEWHDQPVGPDPALRDGRTALNRDDLVETERGQSARVRIPVSEPPGFVITIGGLAGGRQLLSDDVSMLASVALLTARRIDAIRLTRERYDGRVREQEMSRLATEAELRALRSQINPHFLFNALTTIGYLIQAAPDRAVQTLMRLTSLLRAVLRSEGEFTTLGREMDLIESYLDIERARFEQRLQVHIDVPVTLRGAPVPTLVLQPIVENAIKHGIAPLRQGGELVVTARIEDAGGAGAGDLILQVEDTGRGVTKEALIQGRREGVGLNNVERRLAGHYGAAASLAIRSTPDRGTRVTIRLPAPVPAAVLPFGRQKP